MGNALERSQVALTASGVLRTVAAFMAMSLLNVMVCPLVMGLWKLLLYTGCSKTATKLIVLPTGLLYILAVYMYAVSPLFDWLLPKGKGESQKAQPPDGSDAATPSEGDASERE